MRFRLPMRACRSRLCDVDMCRHAEQACGADRGFVGRNERHLGSWVDMCADMCGACRDRCAGMFGDMFGDMYIDACAGM